MIDLKTLKDDTETVLGGLAMVRANDGDETRNLCVNWSDLRCVEAWIRITDDGFVEYGVTVSEASPNDGEFQELVARRLGWRYHNVTVKTEW